MSLALRGTAAPALDGVRSEAYPRARTSERAVAAWLLVCCAAIFCMVVLGGVTRLTGSGLSMVEWEPIMGVIPPLNDADWQEAFQLYQQYPEYQLKNRGMDVEGFKSIFWLEWGHRVLGRVIGILFAVPFLYFAVRGRIPAGFTPRLLGLFLLGGLQGLMGWYMVQSGMVDNPSVSQYRLTAHLLLAVVIFAAMLWVALDVLALRARASSKANDAPGSRRLFRWSLTLVAFVLLTIASGGFVAGLKAGFTYNTFPLMNGQLVPDGIALMEPLWRNAFENITTIQFNHRWLAMTLAVCVVGFGVFAWTRTSAAGARRALGLMLAAVALQVTLGITTLLMVVPIPLAAAHQAGAVALLAALVYVAHVLRPGPGVSPPEAG